MPIEFYCTECRCLLRTGDETAGKQARCPECGAIVPIPAESVGAGPPPNSGPDLSGPALPETLPLPPAPGADYSQPSPGSENPFESPRVDTGIPPLPYVDLYAYAAGRLLGPAIALIVLSGLTIASQLFMLGMHIIGMGIAGAAGGEQGAAKAVAAGTTAIVLHLVTVLINLAVIVGAIKMIQVQGYALAMTSVALAMLPLSCLVSPPISICCLPFWFFELLAAVWALVALSDPQVRSAFPK